MKYFIEDTTLTGIGDAIRAKNGTSDLIPVTGLADAITNLPAGEEPVLQFLDVTKNGEYYAPEGVHGFNPVFIDVPEVAAELGPITITENGTYRAPDYELDGFKKVFVEVPTGGGAEVEPIVLTGGQTYGCAGPLASKYIELFGDTISTQDLGDVDNMFHNNTVTKIPFDLNCSNAWYYSFQSLFSSCNNLTELPNIYNAYPSSVSQMFSNCYNLREIPEGIDATWNWDRIHTYNYAGANSLFVYCRSLRKIPESFMKNIWGKQTATYSSPYNNLCQMCMALDEIRGIPTQPVTYTSNAFGGFLYCCYRVKEVIFDMNDDGTAKTASWKGQSINLEGIGQGYSYSPGNVYNSGITADKEVYDEATYQALKDDPDWFSRNIAYSRYNHDSAVNTINSLPDTSAYLTANGGTNTIIFKGDMGSATEGGAISNLTEEEIAIATAKGWTVTLV